MNHADTTAQPAPAPGRASATDAVVADMLARREQGTRKYGTELQTGNGRDALVDAYQESLDLTMYLKQTLMERDAEAADNLTLRQQLEWHGCMTGDCPHETQAECNAAIFAHVRELTSGATS